MNYKGAYDGSTNYAVGDVAVYTDGIPYVMHTDAPAGIPCHNVLYWERVPQPLAEAVVMFHSMLTALQATKAAVDGVIFDSKTLILDSSTDESTKKWAITVDDTDGIQVDEVTDD